jgi:hypothetical protein
MAALETMNEALSTPVVDGAFAEILRQNRARFNAQFAAAQLNAPTLDGALFGQHLSTRVAPLVETVFQSQPQRASEVASALYEISLELFAKNLLGQAPRSTLVPLLWEKLVPVLAPILGKRVLGALCNAAVQLENTPGARGDAWIDAMRILVELHPLQSDDSDDFLRAGQIIAWRCGLAQLRPGALKTARELALSNEVMARFALGVQDESTPLEEIISHLERDAWFLPSPPALWKRDSEDGVRVRKIAGAFRGFEKDNQSGAVFQTPPRVAVHNNQLFAFDEENCWLVFADIFGASFHRIGSLLEFASDPSTPNFSGVVEERVNLPEFEYATSSARLGSTLAVTLPHSHAIYFVA